MAKQYTRVKLMKLDNLECHCFLLCLRVWKWILVELWLCMKLNCNAWIAVDVIFGWSNCGNFAFNLYLSFSGHCWFMLHSKFFLLDYGWFMLLSRFFLLDYGCLISISVVIWLSWCIFCVNYILLHFWMFSLFLHVVCYLNVRGNASYIMRLTRVVISCFSRFFLIFFFWVCHCVISLSMLLFAVDILCGKYHL